MNFLLRIPSKAHEVAKKRKSQWKTWQDKPAPALKKDVEWKPHIPEWKAQAQLKPYQEKSREEQKGRSKVFNPPSNKPKIDLSQVECYYCKEKGHFANDCPKKTQKAPVKKFVFDPKESESQDLNLEGYLENESPINRTFYSLKTVRAVSAQNPVKNLEGLKTPVSLERFEIPVNLGRLETPVSLERFEIPKNLEICEKGDLKDKPEKL